MDIRYITTKADDCSGGGLVARSRPTLTTPQIVARQALLSMGFLRHEYWRVGCHFLLQRIFLTQESNPGVLHCRRILY